MTGEPGQVRDVSTEIDISPAIMDRVESVRQQYVPDSRSGVFDVQVEQRDSHLVLRGQSTHAGALDELVAQLRVQGITAVDEVIRLPDPLLGDARHALVRSAVAPIYSEPHLPAPQVSQLVLGMRVDLLSRTGDWLRVRGEDGYVGWVQTGYLQIGSEDWAFAWERGTAGEPVVSIGAELVDEDDRVIARLPWGARLSRRVGALHLPDGRSGTVMHGDVIDVDRLRDWFPSRGESVARTGRRWLGTPYLWGGVTQAGVDCSGFTQAVMWMHGIALPRDSDLQARIGIGVALEPDVTLLRPGDLLFFADSGARVNHVAVSLGGPLILHSALGNGGVDINDLGGDRPLERRLVSMFVSARRLLAD